MIILNLKMDNVLSFNNFEVCFSYPVKLRKTLIENENLKSIDSFRYKKLIVFLGANATGKTSLIRCIWAVLLFLRTKEKASIEKVLNDNEYESRIEMDFVEENEKSYLRRVIISQKNQNLYMACGELLLKQGDSYESKVKELSNLEYDFKDYLECLNGYFFKHGWNVVLPATEFGFDTIKFLDTLDKDTSDEYLYIIEQMMKTLDPSIKSVVKSMDTNDAIVIDHENAGKIIMQNNNKISEISKLSSGTKYALNLANIIYSIKHHNNGIYLIDEQFSYVSSEIESAILTTLVAMLNSGEQLFFTTHNQSILDLGYPFHSYYFLKKEDYDNKQRIIVSCATDVENRNNVPVRSIVENDMLGTAPKVNKIFEIGERINLI